MGRVKMSDYFLFYWLSWVLIIVIYFFIEKKFVHYIFFSVIFLTIILIDINLIIFNSISMNLSYIILFISAFLYCARLSLSLYNLFVAITVMLAYVGLLLWEKVSPVWFVLDSRFMVPLFIASIISLLIKSDKTRIATLVFGLSMGQFLFDFILINHGLHLQIGSFYFFINLYITVFLLFISSIFRQIILFLTRKLPY